MKRYKTFFYIFLLVLIIPGCVERAASQSCVDAPSGLVSWWSAESGAQDSRSGNHGALVGGTTFAPGVVGLAFSFDGDDDRVEVPSNATLDPPSGHVTAEAWIYPTLPFTGGGSIINKRTTANNAGYTLERSASKTLYWAIPIDGHFIFISSVAAVPDNSWTHVAGTYDGTTLRIYVNGVDVGSVVHTVGGPVSTTTGKLVIGENIANEINFRGFIDEPSVYDRALSGSEIAAIHAAGPAGKCLPPACPTITVSAFGSLDGNYAVPYTRTITASGGTGPYTYAPAPGSSLPPGLSLNPNTGVISGTPTQSIPGTLYAFTVTATDANGCTGTVDLSLTIGAFSCALVGNASTAISGDLVITGSSATTIDLACLVSITGDLVITNNDQAGDLDLSSLVTVGGNVNISGNAAAANLDLGSLATVSGNLEIGNNPAAGNLDLASLGNVSGNLDIGNNGDAAVNLNDDLAGLDFIATSP